MTSELAVAVEWDIPEGCASDRGWYIVHTPHGRIGANYLDYGPSHYRSGHSYCKPDRLCCECEPGNVHAVVWADWTGSGYTHNVGVMYFETSAQAREWIENTVAAELTRMAAYIG